MYARQKGLGGIQLLLLATSFTALSFIVGPEYGASGVSVDSRTLAEKATVAEALDYARESREKITSAFAQSGFLPRTAGEAYSMKPSMESRPEFIRQIKFQHDHAGEMVMIKLYLKGGAVENILGGEQYVYFAGYKSSTNEGSINWECSGRNVDLTLFPDYCRS